MFGQRTSGKPTAMLLTVAFVALLGAGSCQSGDDIRPGTLLTDPPTLKCLGFRWYIDGDDNRNATVTVEYRKTGETDWQKALPMLRVHRELVDQDYTPHRCGNLFAGSVMELEPNTDYEVRLQLRDPDGGEAEETLSARTRPVPQAPAPLRTLHVYPPGHAGAKSLPAFDSLADAVAALQPGYLALLYPGVHRGPLRIETSGTPEHPIVFRGVTDGEAIIEGSGHDADLLDIDGADYLFFEHLTLRKARAAIRAGKTGTSGATGLVVRRCTILDSVTGIITYSENSTNWYIADNTITGFNPTWYPRPKDYMSPAHTGVNIYGRGHVVCHNSISRYSDALAIANFGPPVDDVRKHCVAIDFHNNDLWFAQDDGIEADFGCHNVRVFRNRVTNAHSGLSAQPFYGGPCYFIRNELYCITGATLKLHNYCSGLEIHHNTCVSSGRGFSSFERWQNGILRNNLFVGAQRYAMETGSITPYTSLDYNGWRKNDDPEGRFLKWFDGKDWGRYPTIEALFKATGHEEHGVQVNYDIFVNAAPPEEGKTYEPGSADLRLKEGAPAVDAGQVLPNVNDGFAGKAPDLGCYELGQEMPQYGPREE